MRCVFVFMALLPSALQYAVRFLSRYTLLAAAFHFASCDIRNCWHVSRFLATVRKMDGAKMKISNTIKMKKQTRIKNW